MACTMDMSLKPSLNRVHSLGLSSTLRDTFIEEFLSMRFKASPFLLFLSPNMPIIEIASIAGLYCSKHRLFKSVLNYVFETDVLNAAAQSEVAFVALFGVVETRELL